MKTAIVLVGGRGTRLRPITDEIPKPLIRVCSRPLLYWVLKWLTFNNIKKVVLGVAYKKEKIKKYISEINFPEMNIEISEHLVSDGTSTAVKKALGNCTIPDSDFLVINGDTLTNIPINELYSFHLRNKKIITMVVVPLQCDFGIVDVKNGEVLTFREKPVLSSILINAGIYVFSQKITQFLYEGNLEEKVFPKLATKRLIAAYIWRGFWRTINTVKDLEKIEAEFKNKDIEETLKR